MPRLTLRRVAALLAAVALSLSASLSAHETQEKFAFSPVPRWTDEPENEQVCRAVKKECSKIWKNKQEDFQIGYELMYDTNGTISGMRITQSSQCKPVDEYYQMFKRALLFTPKLEDIRVELPEGVKPEDVRIVKSDSTSFSVNCPR